MSETSRSSKVSMRPLPLLARSREKKAMNRRGFLKAIGSAALVPMMPRGLLAATTASRVRPSDAAWPSKSAWKQLDETVGGNLFPVEFPLSVLKTNPDSNAAKLLLKNLKNPYYIGDQAGLTETLGWVDAWNTQPSVYAAAARNAQDIAATVNFARENNLRLAVKGGGHSYQGTSNAPDSLLIWTRRMHDITMHDAFVPQACEKTLKPQPAMTLVAGTIGIQAYESVSTQAGKYVQGGACLTVGLAGLIQGGGFGSFSKHYGTAAGSLLEAEVVTADGQIRIANACTNSDLFWALKGGGGGSFGVVSRLTVRTHELPEYFGSANLTVAASSADEYQRLIRRFVSFYHDSLFNDHWGEQFHVNPDNTLEVQMNSCGLNRDEQKKVWQPFLDWVRDSSHGCSIKGRVDIGAFPARHLWDPQWWKAHWPESAFPRNGIFNGLLDDVLLHVMSQPVFDFDPRHGANPDNAWWQGNTGECSIFWSGYESLWIPSALLEPNSQQRFADAMFAASRHWGVAMHCNKGLAGAPPEARALARDTAMNPAVVDAFALAITAAGRAPAYPGIPGHEPDVADAREAAKRVDDCVKDRKSTRLNSSH